MLKSLLTSGFILELFSRKSFEHSVNVISNVVKESKIKELRTTTEGRQSEQCFICTLIKAEILS